MNEDGEDSSDFRSTNPTLMNYADRVFASKMDEIIRELVAKEDKILNSLLVAFIAETGLVPSQCKLIRQDDFKGNISFWFEKRSK